MTSPSFLLLKINQLGDAIWFLPTVAGIRREFPDSRIDVVCNRSTAVIFEKSVTGVRAITVSYKHVRSLRGMLSLPRMALKLGLGRYDYALLSHDEPKFSHLLALAVLARRRIGFDLVNRGLARLLSEVLPDRTGRNLVDLNFDLARRVTGQPDLALVRVPLGYDPHDAETVEQRLQAVGIDPSLPFVVLHPFAALTYKEWGIEKFLELARRITEEFDLPVVITSEKERPRPRLAAANLGIVNSAARGAPRARRALHRQQFGTDEHGRRYGHADPYRRGSSRARGGRAMDGYSAPADLC